MIKFDKPLEDDYEDFFKRYYDLGHPTDKMMEFREK